MKITKSLVTVALVTSLATLSFAAPMTVTNSGQQAMVVVQQEETCEKQQDLIGALENKKAKLQEQVKAGKMTQKEADEIKSRLDKKIQSIEEFNALDVAQKKEKLTAHFSEVMETRVKEGKLTQEEANKRLQDYTEEINQWDGIGFPKFSKKHWKHQR